VSPVALEARLRRWSGVLAWAVWLLAMLGLAVAAWLDHLQRQAGSPETAWLLQAGSVPLLMAAVSAVTVGALLGSRRPAHPVGWLLLGLGLLVVANGVVSGYVSYGLLARPGALPAASYLAGISNGIQVLWLACGGFVLLLTPTGSLPSPRWRWWARVAAAAPVLLVLLSAVDPQPLLPEHPTVGNPLAVPVPAGLLLAVAAVDAVLVLATLVAAAGSLVARFRRARGTERQQLRWLAVGAALATVALLVAVAGGAMSKDGVVLAGLGTCVALLPLATGAAILRYRLYDLDRIISRTVAYGLLTVLLGGGYAAVVLGLGQLLGRDSNLVVAMATLAVAALFQPARHRIQQAVDRRFNRRRYDAARTIAAFSDRLRQQVDLDTLTAELLAVVEQTVQPTRASLWLRPPVERFPTVIGDGWDRVSFREGGR
jgi:MFS family permease